jgi:hypothetical protein
MTISGPTWSTCLFSAWTGHILKNIFARPISKNLDISNECGHRHNFFEPLFGFCEMEEVRTRIMRHQKINIDNSRMALCFFCSRSASAPTFYR